MSLTTVKRALADSGLDPIDARALLRHVLDADDAYLIAHREEPLLDVSRELFLTLVGRRKAGEPVAYITGSREFFSLAFKVTPAVLIPRPETELLVEFALEHIEPRSAKSVLDLGTGSGCIAISIARGRPLAHVLALDASAEALAVARDNASNHRVTNVKLLQSDWFEALAGQRFDLIVANPPYVTGAHPHLKDELRYEPAAALVAANQGLACIELIIAESHQYLNTGGWLAFEHGYDQGVYCRELLAKAGYTRVFSRVDLAGFERVSGGQTLRSP
jgi:release factor glutamine methyltransferase